MDLSTVRIVHIKGVHFVYDGRDVIYSGAGDAMPKATLRRMIAEGYAPLVNGGETTFKKVSSAS